MRLVGLGRPMIGRRFRGCLITWVMGLSVVLWLMVRLVMRLWLRCWSRPQIRNVRRRRARLTLRRNSVITPLAAVGAPYIIHRC